MLDRTVGSLPSLGTIVGELDVVWPSSFPRGEAYVTLAHASSLYVGLKRSVLLSPTPHAALTAETAPEYVEFFLDRGTANCSVRYISLWQGERGNDDLPPLTGFRFFGTEFTPFKSPNIPISGSEEAPVRQFALAELQLNVDLHAISVPYRRRDPSA